MAKINLTTQYNQENLSAVASLGALICMVVAVVGIKLWWFKHRLSLEQTNNQNGTAGASKPAITFTRSNKQQKYKKDKRYSQEIYNTLEVHGVFRQKREDDLEIHQPKQLPPVRLRQQSESSSLLLLPPSRTKRRDQVNSTAFEDLEIATSPLTTASSSSLTAITAINTTISLTFEEFEKQFKLKEDLKSQFPDPLNNEVIEISVPPLLLNRSSSAMMKPEKIQRSLKSSHSISVPEFYKVIEKRSMTGFSSPKDDLTKIHDYDEPKLFETFGERRPTGYIKYEEVDSDLQEHYEMNLNAAEDYQFTVNDNCERSKVPDKKAFRNEHTIYNDDLNESAEVQYTKNASVKRLQLESVNATAGAKLGIKCQSVSNANDSTNINDEVRTVMAGKSMSEFGERQFNAEFCSVKELRPAQYVEHYQTNGEEYVMKSPSFKKEADIVETECVTGIQRSAKMTQKDETVEKDVVTDPPLSKQNVSEYSSVMERTPNEIVQETMMPISSNENSHFVDSSNLQDVDNQFSTWPQFEEKIKTPKVNFRRFGTLSSFEETDDLGVNKNSSVSFSLTGTTNDLYEKFTLNQRRPTGFVRDWPDSPEFTDTEEWQDNFNKKLYNQVRAFMSADPITNLEQREVTFNSLVAHNMNSDDHNNSITRERRPIAFERKNNYSVTYNDDSDQDNKRSLPANHGNSNLEIVEIESKVNFANGELSISQENETEKFTLKQRRPTRFLKPQNNEESWNDINLQKDSEDTSKAKVKFVETTNFRDEEEIWNSNIKQRRPTGFEKKFEIFDLTDEETACHSLNSPNQPTTFNPEFYMDDFKNFENCELRHKSATVRFAEIEHNFNGYNNNAESLLKQRRPTGFVRKEELVQLEKQVNFQLAYDENNISSKKNKALIENEEVSKKPNFALDHNLNEDEKPEFEKVQLKQQSTSDFVRKRELKCLEHPAPIHHPSNDDTFDNDFDDHLWHEIEKDVEQDNLEEEFAKIRHSYELNEADFLELKDELQKSPTNEPQQPLGFGKSIDEDWENFENLKTHNIEPLKTPHEIKTSFSNVELAATNSILKENKLHEDTEAKPRKSKVTFDYKIDERVIPIRENDNYSDYNDDVHDKLLLRIPPQPMQRAPNINYNMEDTLTPNMPIPTEISLFASPISQEDNDVEDSWSAIRQHRNLTVDLQNRSTDSKLTQPSRDINAPPQSPYRNPMAQLAIKRAKEVRGDMEGFKSRSINDKKSESSRSQKQKCLNFSNHHYGETTEA